jgi:hypothetical protein
MKCVPLARVSECASVFDVYDEVCTPIMCDTILNSLPHRPHYRWLHHTPPIPPRHAPYGMHRCASTLSF